MSSKAGIGQFVPLKEAIEKLIQSLDKLEKAIDAERNSRHILEIKVQEIDDRAKSLQHRMDKLEGKVDGG